MNVHFLQDSSKRKMLTATWTFFPLCGVQRSCEILLIRTSPLRFCPNSDTYEALRYFYFEIGENSRCCTTIVLILTTILSAEILIVKLKYLISGICKFSTEKETFIASAYASYLKPYIHNAVAGFAKHIYLKLTILDGGEFFEASFFIRLM